MIALNENPPPADEDPPKFEQPVFLHKASDIDEETVLSAPRTKIVKVVIQTGPNAEAAAQRLAGYLGERLQSMGYAFTDSCREKVENLTRRIYTQLSNERLGVTFFAIDLEDDRIGLLVELDPDV